MNYLAICFVFLIGLTQRAESTSSTREHRFSTENVSEALSVPTRRLLEYSSYPKAEPYGPFYSSSDSSLCLESKDGYLAMKACSYSDSQLFQRGFRRFQQFSKTESNCLYETDDGFVQVSTCDQSDQQAWTANNDQAFHSGKNSNNCITSMGEGERVEVKACSGGKDQKFVRVAPPKYENIKHKVCATFLNSPCHKKAWVHNDDGRMTTQWNEKHFFYRTHNNAIVDVKSGKCWTASHGKIVLEPCRSGIPNDQYFRVIPYVYKYETCGSLMCSTHKENWQKIYTGKTGNFQVLSRYEWGDLDAKEDPDDDWSMFEFSDAGVKCNSYYGGSADSCPSCSSLYTYNNVVPSLIQDLQKAIDSGKYDSNMYRSFDLALWKLHSGGYDKELAECLGENSWTKHDSCRVFFLQPIIGVISSYAAQSQNEDKVNEWFQASLFQHKDWAKVNSDMSALVKNALSKKSDKFDTDVVRREMMYTMLHTVSSENFPFNESPFSSYSSDWYSFVDNANDEEIKKTLEVQVEQEVQDYCSQETVASPLCSFVSTKNQYSRTLMYLPKEMKAKTDVVSVSAYVGGENGLYGSFKENLDEFLQTTEIKDAIDDLSGKLSDYFSSLASFDNDIANADVAYVKSAISKNDEQLTTNVNSLQDLVEQIKEQQSTCAVLDVFESILTVAVGIATTVAGGAGVSMSIKGIEDTYGAVTTATTTFYKATEIMTTTLEKMSEFKETVSTMQTQEKHREKIKEEVSGIESVISDMLSKFEKNQAAIEAMDKVVEAVLNGASLDSVKEEAKSFVTSYGSYSSAVTKTDLVELNDQYSGMLESFEEAFSDSGFLCSLVEGDASSKVGEAQGVWTSIYSLLLDVYEQQAEYIDALVKVVRSKLDGSLAKKFSPSVNYNFEIAVRHHLAVRVAAQEVCSTFQFLNNDKKHDDCEKIENVVFMTDSMRDRVKEIDDYLLQLLPSYGTTPRYAYLPASQGWDDHSVNWENLVSGRSVFFQLDQSDHSFAKTNGWSDYSDEVGLVKSMEVFIPGDFFGTTNNKDTNIRFSITAIQDRISVSGKKVVEKYTLKSSEPVSTKAKYILNPSTTCSGTEMDNLFVSDDSKYCIPNDSGIFGNVLKPSLPVSMYSKFQIQMIDGHDKNGTLSLFRPFGNTLKLRVRLQMFTNSGGRRSRNLRSSSNVHVPENSFCGKGQYREVVDAQTQVCKPCPEGSVPVSRGSYCISNEDAQRIAEKTGTTVEALN